MDILKRLDFTEEDGSDPLKVDEFVRNRAYHFKNNNVTKVWAAIDEKSELVAYFTVSMTSIKTTEFPVEEQAENVGVKYYPAMLLGQMSVGKKHRGKKIGSMITHFCTGLALFLAKRVACRYVILRTDQNHLEYYQKYCSFTPSVKAKYKPLFFMYRRLF